MVATEPLLNREEKAPDRQIHINRFAASLVGRIDSLMYRPDLNQEQDFPGNEVSTTKYSIVSFVPKNLWEQFQRVANLYFLLISLVQVRVRC